ncbi:hypothetical protein CLF_100008 [Clonorchis sinensis]|uniref:Uncharacterized protein n=1 Tax=Clonorchis sinensis TaxID=79923 RepID=G7Y2G8_CLOSI|nr:hypothetical protein CLF_100008 [Clonorchis sinensis]
MIRSIRRVLSAVSREQVLTEEPLTTCPMKAGRVLDNRQLILITLINWPRTIYCSHLGNRAASKPLCFIQVAWQPGTRHLDRKLDNMKPVTSGMGRFCSLSDKKKEGTEKSEKVKVAIPTVDKERTTVLMDKSDYTAKAKAMLSGTDKCRRVEQKTCEQNH